MEKKETEKLPEEIKEKIEEAQLFARENHEKAMKRIKAYNPNFKREWEEIRFYPYKNKKLFALSGTPHKAFVLADLETLEVKAYNQRKELLKQW